ncbi:MAG: hypothetical protein QME92_05760 [Bacillota bacterium]|nr:hypothetical protein [Bacillota bacterium]
MKVKRMGVCVALIVSALLGAAGIVWYRGYGARALLFMPHGMA